MPDDRHQPEEDEDEHLAEAAVAVRALAAGVVPGGEHAGGAHDQQPPQAGQHHQHQTGRRGDPEAGEGGPLHRAGLGHPGADQAQRAHPDGVGAAHPVGVVVGVVDPDLQGQADQQGEQRRDRARSRPPRPPRRCRPAPGPPRPAGCAGARRPPTAPRSGGAAGSGRCSRGVLRAVDRSLGQVGDQLSAVDLATGRAGEGRPDHQAAGQRRRSGVGRRGRSRRSDRKNRPAHRDEPSAGSAWAPERALDSAPRRPRRPPRCPSPGAVRRPRPPPSRPARRRPRPGPLARRRPGRRSDRRR